MNTGKTLFGVVLFLLLAAGQQAVAGPIRDWLMERKAAKLLEQQQEEIQASDGGAAFLPAGAQLLRDVAYGSDSEQRMDVYLPHNPKNAPVILMVHGGAWSLGDKTMRTVVENKIARWLPRGFIFISVNYRLVPKADPVQQADDVAHALAKAQNQAASWGGDPSKFILMGHSAGAHLSALLAAAPAKAFSVGAKPWLGTVLLDSGALDVTQIMRGKHYRFYDKAFGERPDYWQAASPFQLLAAPTAPILAVCSSRRDESCPQAKAFADKAAALGTRTSLLPEDLSHKEINDTLGTPGAYTQAVEDFMGSLDATVKNALAGR